MTAQPLFHVVDRPAFERAVPWLVLAAAASGALQGLLAEAGLRLGLATLVLLAAAGAGARGDWVDKAAVWGGAWVAAILGPPILEGAAVGVLLVFARRRERGAADPVDLHPIGLGNYLLGAGAGAVLFPLGLEVGRLLGDRLEQLGAPAVAAAGAAGGVAGLFLAFSRLGGHLALRTSPVELAAADLLPRLQGDQAALIRRALESYRFCAKSLERLPADARRHELADRLAAMAQQTLSLAGDWEEIDRDLAEAAPSPEEIDALTAEAAGCADPLARAQLESAAQAIRSTAAAVGELELRRERVRAKLRAQAALLEQARIALVAMRGGQAQLQSAALAELSTRVASLTRTEELEGRLAHEAAVSAELTVIERRATRMR